MSTTLPIGTQVNYIPRVSRVEWKFRPEVVIDIPDDPMRSDIDISLLLFDVALDAWRHATEMAQRHAEGAR